MQNISFEKITDPKNQIILFLFCRPTDPIFCCLARRPKNELGFALQVYFKGIYYQENKHCFNCWLLVRFFTTLDMVNCT